MIWEVLKIAMGALREYKFRSFLTVLSVTIGAFSIVVMTSLAEAGSMTLARSVEEIGGARLVWWVPSPSRDARDRDLYAKGITLQDAEALQDLPFVRLTTGMATMDQETVYYRANNTAKVDIVAMLDGLLAGLSWEIEKGRAIEPSDHSTYARVCVISHELAERLFPDGPSLGEHLTVLAKPYLVIGVLKPRKMLLNVSLGFDWEKSVFIPLSTAQKREGVARGNLVLVAFTKTPADNRNVMALGNGKLLSRHNGVADFKSIDFGEIIGSFNKFFAIVNLIVGVVAGISLLAGGIGVMNIMLVSVTERVREIGIRKSLGATVGTILFQFLSEAVVLSSTGGLIGVLLGIAVVFGANLVVAEMTPFWVPTYSWIGIGLALGTTGSIGVLFGAIPAYQAARLDIVECLRR